MAKKITAYQAEDSAIFMSEIEANIHETIRILEYQYEENPIEIYSTGDEYIYFSELLDYVKENKDFFQTIIDMDNAQK